MLSNGSRTLTVKPSIHFRKFFRTPCHASYAADDITLIQLMHQTLVGITEEETATLKCLRIDFDDGMIK